MPASATGRRARTEPAQVARTGQLHDETRPAWLVRVHADVAVVVRHDAGDDREAEAGAVVLRRVVGLEDAAAVFVGNADAVVGDLEPRRLQRRVVDGADLDAARLAGGLAGRTCVVQEVREHAADLLAVEVDPGKRLVEVRLEAHALGPRVARDRLAHEPVQVVGPQVGLGEPGELGELVHQHLQSVDVAGDGVDGLVEDLRVVRLGEASPGSVGGCAGRRAGWA